MVKHDQVFTPPDIAKTLTSFINNRTPKTILEPSCGNGAILELLHKKHSIDAIDIDKELIDQNKKSYPKINFMNEDFTDFKTTKKYDYIIGNPPYIRIQDMNKDTYRKIKDEYPEYIKGNSNLYLYFILRSLELLKKNGKIIFIIPNSWLYNKSMEPFKRKLIEHLETIINFKDKKMFKDALTYTCVVVLSNRKTTEYKYCDYSIDNCRYVKKVYDDIQNQKKQLTQTLKPKIGLMTLCDQVFIIKNYHIQDDHIVFTTKTKKPVETKEYKIEKEACKDLLKVSKKEKYKIIYPYFEKDGKIVPIPDLDKIYPLAYKYLLEHKEKLQSRDAGKAKYPYWYCYGRTQALKCCTTPRLFISTIVNDNLADYLYVETCDLYYSGMCIYDDVDKTKKIILDNTRSIIDNSAHKQNGWYSISHSSFKDIAIT